MISRKPFIIAHRGASALAPENTFAAFRQAIEDGAEGIEFDVHLAKDNTPVVIHDSNLKRLANVESRVSDFTAEELNEVDVGSWFNKKYPQQSSEKFSAETVPALARLLEFLRDYKGLIYVELKGADSEIFALAEMVCELIHPIFFPNIIIKSFNLEAIQIVKRILPDVRAAALFEPKILTILRKERLILDEARKYAADEISIHYSLATKKFVRLAHEKNFPVTIWTADNPIWVRRAFDYGINAIITNNPARLLAKRGEILR